MSRIARLHRDQNSCRQTADTRFVSRKNPSPDMLDDVERKFLEPVARYLAILQEWALQNRPDKKADPRSEQP
jgi:hypothetical protein